MFSLFMTDFILETLEQGREKSSLPNDIKYENWSSLYLDNGYLFGTKPLPKSNAQ